MQSVVLTSGQDLSIHLFLCRLSDEKISMSRGTAWFPHNFWNICSLAQLLNDSAGRPAQVEQDPALTKALLVCV